MVKNISARDTLFGDLPLDYWAALNAEELPWSLFSIAKKNIDKGQYREAIETLKLVVDMPGLESRHYLQACHFLNELGSYSPGQVKLYGVVVEVSIEQGHDFLAVYADHSARYYNYSGSAIIWDKEDVGIANKIDEILKQGIEIVAKIGPWKDARPPAPGKEMARISFLTSHGLHFGEAAQAILFNDPMAGKIMYAMLDMMETLISKTSQN